MADKEQRAKWKEAGKRLEAHDAVAHAEERAEQRSRDRMYMLGGALLITIGVAVTIWTYSAATVSGGSYAIMYGPVIVGIGLVVKGLLGKD